MNTLELTPRQARLRALLDAQVKPEIYELVAVNRLNAKEQTSVRRFQELDDAKAEAESRRKSEPLKYFVVFCWVADFCRLVCWHTL